MIPLSRWLSKQEGTDCALSALEPHIENPPDLQASLDTAFEQGRQAAMASAGASFAAELQEERQKFALREQEIAEKWQAHCTGHITEKINEAFLDMKSSIETALMTVLQPFVEDAAGGKAIDTLFAMLGEEMADSADSCLEINAPPALHEELSARTKAMGLGSRLTDGNTMNITARLGSVRFESMASLWIEALRGSRA